MHVTKPTKNQWKNSDFYKTINFLTEIHRFHQVKNLSKTNWKINSFEKTSISQWEIIDFDDGTVLTIRPRWGSNPGRPVDSVLPAPPTAIRFDDRGSRYAFSGINAYI